MKANDEVKFVGEYTAGRIESLLALPDAQRRASLAELRRGIGHAPGALPELWGTLLSGLWQSEEDPAKFAQGNPTYEEWAVYTALTLFAMHQQGSDGSVHVQGRRFGTAVGQLVKGQDDLERVLHRFTPAATSADMAELSHHLRGLIQILRAGSIGFDYADLAQDLYRYQLSDESKDRVRLKWGRDFYREVYKMAKDTEEVVTDE